MASELIYNDLVAVPLGHAAPGIYWLRYYLTRAGHVVVLTEVPGNPSLSITNAISRVLDHLTQAFALDPTRAAIFEIWPKGANWPPEQVRYLRVTVTPVLGWHEVTRDDVEAAADAPLLPLPDHDELLGRVLSVGGGTREPIFRPVFAPLPVQDLPPPHLPSRCAHFARFEEMADSGEAEEGSSAGRAFLVSLTEVDRLACPYHGPHWRVAADESVRIIGRLGRQEVEHYRTAAEGLRLSPEAKRALLSLFDRPITVRGGFIDGQHRSCAIRFSGARECAVDVDEEESGAYTEEWSYGGGG